MSASIRGAWPSANRHAVARYVDGVVRLGFLQCDMIDPPHVDIDGDYDELFDRLFLGHTIELVVYRADQGQLPRSTADCDAWLIPGSRAGVYEDLGWLPALEKFTARLLEASRPLIGVCFGHQLIAKVLGAPVARSEMGWNIGAVDYRLRAQPPGDTSGHDTFTLIASHRDQVLELPAGTTLLADAPTCPVAGFTTDFVLTIQAHPEFTAGLAGSLCRGRVDHLGHQLVDAALATLDRPLDHARVARWIAAFLAERTGLSVTSATA